jgi:hypothetical protein
VAWVLRLRSVFSPTLKIDYFNVRLPLPNQSRPESLLETIFTQPFTKVRHLVVKKRYAENTERQYLNQLVELGVCEKRRISGGDYYLNLELYRILGS